MYPTLVSNYRWSGRTVAARRAARASDMMRIRHGLPWWAGELCVRRLWDSCVDPRIQFIEQVFDFRFHGGFLQHFESVGGTQEDVEFWYLNAQAFAKLTLGVELTNEDKHRLMTLIESARFSAVVMADFPQLEPEFDFSPYGFPKAFVDRW